MTSLDEQIYRLVRDRVAEAPAPMSVVEVVARREETAVGGCAPSPRRRVWPVLVAAAAALVATVVVLDNTRDRSTEPAGAVLAEHHLLLPTLADGWVPSRVEFEPEPWFDEGYAAAIYSRESPAARLQLTAYPRTGSALSFPNRFELADGRKGSWDFGCAGGSGMCFDLRSAGQYVHGAVSGAGIDGAHVAALEELAGFVSTDANGVPVIDPSSGFVVEHSGEVAQGGDRLSIDFVSGGGDGIVLGLTIEVGGQPVEAALRAGAWADEREVDGVEYWLAHQGSMVIWWHGGALYKMFGAPTDADVFELATTAQSATWIDIAELAGQIGSTALLAEATEIGVAGRTLDFEERRIGDHVYACLDDGSEPVCRAVWQDGAASIVLDGHWYLVQYDRSSTPAPILEMVVTGRNRWRVSAIADDMTTVRIGVDPFIITRPRF